MAPGISCIHPCICQIFFECLVYAKHTLKGQQWTIHSTTFIDHFPVGKRGIKSLKINKYIKLGSVIEKKYSKTKKYKVAESTIWDRMVEDDFSGI